MHLCHATFSECISDLYAASNAGIVSPKNDPHSSMGKAWCSTTNLLLKCRTGL